jgi:hypothetical protein
MYLLLWVTTVGLTQQFPLNHKVRVIYTQNKLFVKISFTILFILSIMATELFEKFILVGITKK